MKTFDKQEWARIRAKGHAHFILRQGLLRWGVPFGLVVSLGSFVCDLAAHAPKPSIGNVVGSVAFLTLAFGYGMGETAWRRGERACRDA